MPSHMKTEKAPTKSAKPNPKMASDMSEAKGTRKVDVSPARHSSKEGSANTAKTVKLADRFAEGKKATGMPKVSGVRSSGAKSAKPKW